MLRVNTYALLRLIAISSLVSTTTAQFKMADFGDPCINYENPFEPGKVCYYSKGLDCTGFSNFGGPVCSCYGGFVYDPESKECRRKVGNWCLRVRDPKELEGKPWNDKCQENAECTGRGICTCKRGFYLRPGGSSCVSNYF